jgi:alanine dehydrogenase
MKVGVPTEIKTDEYRVALTPAGVRELVEQDHEVIIQSEAGVGSTIPDGEYVAQGARIVPDAQSVFDEAEMILGVKEPQPQEVEMLRPNHLLFTYLHLAPNPELTKGLSDSGATCVAYETVVDEQGRLPLLAPMSEVAGKIATQAGAFFLERPLGGRGVLLGGVPGVPPGEVVVLGGGVSGTHAATIALGMGATVFVVDRSAEVLRRLAAQFPGLRTIFSTRDALGAILRRADLLVGAVLVPGAAAPKLVTREMVASMKPNSVIVDIAIDQGGCCETSKPTSHSHPTYVEEGVIHYCVTNMPGAVARTSTFALNNATLPFALALADKGWRKAIADDAHLRNGLNVHEGKVTCRPVAEALGLPFTSPEAL